MGSDQEIELVSEHDEAGWKESSRTVTLAKKGKKLILRDRSSGDNPYKADFWSNDDSWEIDIDIAMALIKKHGQKLSS